MRTGIKVPARVCPGRGATPRWVRLSAMVLAAWALAQLLLPSRASARTAREADTLVLRWNSAALAAVRNSKLGPPMVARALAIVHTCIYDAWAAYDRAAVGTQLGSTLRQPALPASPGNRRFLVSEKREAISFAAYRAGVDLFPADAGPFEALLHQLGYSPANTTLDTRTPAGIGNVACDAVLAFRHHDGSNQLGDEPRGTPGVPYSDYSGFVPTNDPMSLTHFDPAAVHDPSRWQPLEVPNAAGRLVTQTAIGPYWGNVAPFALHSSDQVRSQVGPARYGSRQYLQQARDLLSLSAGLTDRQKVIAEYWADGPSSELPPGHWDLFAQFVARRDRLGLDASVKLFFALTNAIFDGGIAAWDDKAAFDSVRPITAVRYLFAGQQVPAWAGPGKGTQLINGADWMPYQAAASPTPAFPEYLSGHSTFSAAGAEILRLFTGSDRFGDSVTLAAGSSTVEPGITPAAPVTLSWRTFSEAADQAGMSRRYGGIHFAQGDLDGRRAGRQVADQAWATALSYFSGRQRPRQSSSGSN